MKKRLELEMANCVELSQEEVLKTQGGTPWWLAELIIAYVVIEAALNPQAHMDAFMAGVESGYKK
jgi:hypothetical protein